MQCPACDAGIEPGDIFCSSCGERLVDAQAKLPDGPIGSGERRQVTALFADLVGSTPLAEVIGEEALFRLMQGIITEMTGAVQDHGGTVEKLTGDGLMALFGAPLAIEDAPLKACQAGLDILHRIAATSDAVAAEHGRRPEVRVGVNTGQAVVGSLGSELQQEVTALGDSVNVAARLEGLAAPGTMVVGEATYRLVADFVESEFAGEHPVKGKTEPQSIWQVNALKAGVRRFDASLRRGLTTLVGRRPELESMQENARIAAAGQTRIVNIVGDVGLGKSRLVHEFRERLPENGGMWLQGNCSAGGQGVPFLPFIEVVRSSFRVAEEESGEAVERRLRRGLEVLGLDPDAEVPYLLNLLGHAVSGDQFSREHAEVAGIRTRDLLQRLVSERCRMAPAVLHVDDLHWVDQASEALLARLVEDSGDLPLLLVFTYRPEYRPPWIEAAAVTTLDLAPLSESATEELLRHRLGVDDLPQTLARLVTEKAEGNPLFAEEIVNYLAERDSLDGSGDGAVGLPVSLENLLMARVDRLADEPRTLLQAASVIGRRFALEVAGEVTGLNGRTAACGAELERLELVRADDLPGEFLFKNALIQEAVYNSLLSERRALLHERAADAIERLHTGGAGEIAETLAHHYGQTPRAEKAVLYMAQAGESSLRVYSLDEAELRLRQVVELIEKVPDCADDAFLVDVLLNLARVQYFRADMYGLIELLQPHLAKVEALDDPLRLSRFLFEIGYAYLFSANTKIGVPLLERARAIGEETGNEHIVGLVDMALVWDQATWHDLDAERRQSAEQLSAEAERIGRQVGDQWLTAKAITALAVMYLVAGRPHLARKHGLRLLDLSRETADPRPRSMGLWLLTLLDATHFALEEAVESGREGARLALSVIDRSIAEAGLGAGLAMLGRGAEALPLLADAYQRFFSRGMLVPLPTIGPFKGIAMLQAGDMAGGTRWIEQCMVRSEAWGSQQSVATGNLVLGEIYTRMALGQDRPALGVMLRNIGFLLRTLPFSAGKARRHLGLALDFFRRVEAPSYTAWALYDLALLDQRKGRRAEAAAKLAEAGELAASVEALALCDMIDAAAQASE
jgi:class 3 adenylate cyclase/tetratricopeptide (TPR) repeat protein